MMLSFIGKLFRNKQGQSLVEYGILVGAIAIVGLVAATTLGHKVTDLLGASAALLPGAHDDDNAPVFSGHLVQTYTGSDGALHVSSIPGTFSNNLGISGAQSLVQD